MLLVSGSLQVKSANRAALDVARRFVSARPDVDAFGSIDVGLLPAFNPDDAEDTHEAVNEFRTQLASADGVVISTPEYAAALPGALKNALDWIVGSGELYAKPVAVISAGTTGGSYARQQLIRTLTWQGAHVVGHLGIAAPRTKSDAEGNLVDSATVSEIGQLVERLVETWDISSEERLARVRRVTDEFGIEPEHISPAPSAD